jgi:hypothetical protein
MSLRRIGARGALDVTRVPYWVLGPEGRKMLLVTQSFKINYKTNKTLRTLNKVASQKKTINILKLLDKLLEIKLKVL